MDRAFCCPPSVAIAGWDAKYPAAGTMPDGAPEGYWIANGSGLSATELDRDDWQSPMLQPHPRLTALGAVEFVDR